MCLLRNISINELSGLCFCEHDEQQGSEDRPLKRLSLKRKKPSMVNVDSLLLKEWNLKIVKEEGIE